MIMRCAKHQHDQTSHPGYGELAGTESSEPTATASDEYLPMVDMPDPSAYHPIVD